MRTFILLGPHSSSSCSGDGCSRKMRPRQSFFSVSSCSVVTPFRPMSDISVSFRPPVAHSCSCCCCSWTGSCLGQSRRIVDSTANADPCSSGHVGDRCQTRLQRTQERSSFTKGYQCQPRWRMSCQHEMQPFVLRVVSEVCKALCRCVVLSVKSRKYTNKLHNETSPAKYPFWRGEGHVSGDDTDTFPVRRHFGAPKKLVDDSSSS